MLIVVVAATCRHDGQYLACGLESDDEIFSHDSPACPGVSCCQSDAGNIAEIMRKLFISHTGLPYCQSYLNSQGYYILY